MIFRRLKAHVEKENWFAVGIDFAIVVIGVFIGIQVANWNEARTDRAAGEAIIKRLHEEVGTLLDIQTSEYDFHRPRIDDLTEVHTLLFGDAPARSLTPYDCRLIGISHWLPSPTDDLPVLEEAIATGRLDLIKDSGVRTNLRSFILVRDRSRRAYQEAVNELYRLTSRHPQAIWYDREPIDENSSYIFPSRQNQSQALRLSGTGYRWVNKCNLEEMRASRVFLAEYVDNISRLNSYIERYEQMIKAMTGLEESLSAALKEIDPE